MKKILSIVICAFLISAICTNSFAFLNPAVNPTVSAVDATPITDSATTHQLSRAVWVGTTQSIDLYINGAWETFQGATAGTEIDVQATGARITSGPANPNVGDVLFLY